MAGGIRLVGGLWVELDAYPSVDEIQHRVHHPPRGKDLTVVDDPLP